MCVGGRLRSNGLLFENDDRVSIIDLRWHTSKSSIAMHSYVVTFHVLYCVTKIIFRQGDDYRVLILCIKEVEKCDNNFEDKLCN